METVTLLDKSFRINIPHHQILQSISELAVKINGDYRECPSTPLLLVVLNGAFMFASDLMKEIEFNCEISFVKLASYEGTSSTGMIKELIGLNENIEGRHVIIVEDIVDTGNSITHLLETIHKKNVASVEVATLLYKPQAYKGKFPIKYYARTIPNDFIVGYGLDYDQLGRNLKDIYKICDE